MKQKISDLANGAETDERIFARKLRVSSNVVRDDIMEQLRNSHVIVDGKVVSCVPIKGMHFTGAIVGDVQKSCNDIYEATHTDYSASADAYKAYVIEQIRKYVSQVLQGLIKKPVVHVLGSVYDSAVNYFKQQQYKQANSATKDQYNRKISTNADNDNDSPMQPNSKSKGEVYGPPAPEYLLKPNPTRTILTDTPTLKPRTPESVEQSNDDYKVDSTKTPYTSWALDHMNYYYGKTPKIQIQDAYSEEQNNDAAHIKTDTDGFWNSIKSLYNAEYETNIFGWKIIGNTSKKSVDTFQEFTF